MWRSQNLPFRSLTISPKGHSLSGRKRELGLGAVYGRGFAAARLRAMELITILNRCHRFRGFVYRHAHFGADKKSIEVAVRPRKGSTAVCSRCHLPAPGYDQLAERPFEFIPLWGFLVVLLYTMRRVDCRRCGVVAVEEVPWGDGKRTLTKAYMLFRWLLLRRSESLGADQHFRLRDLLRYNLKTVRAYLLKEAFQQLWE